MQGRQSGDLAVKKSGGGGFDTNPSGGACGVGLFPQDLDVQPNKPLHQVTGMQCIWAAALRPDAIDVSDFVPAGSTLKGVRSLVAAVLRGRDGGRASSANRDDILGVHEAA